MPTNSQTRVLDAGAGTGYLGKVLHDAGYTSLNLYGIDWCQEMLQHIPREIYVETICADVKKIPYQNDYFDHLISSAVIGLVPKEVFAEFIRVTKPGGYILFNVRDQYYSDDTPFKPEMEALEKKGTWKLVAQKGPLETFANPDFHTLYTFFVYQVM